MHMHGFTCPRGILLLVGFPRVKASKFFLDIFPSPLLLLAKDLAMRVSLEEIKGALTRKKFACEPSVLDLPENVPLFGRTIGVDLQFSRRRGGISVLGEVSFRAELVCSRCAKTFQSHLEEPVDLLYKKGKPEIEEGEVRLSDEETRTVFYDGDTIDLSEPIRDTVLLAMPMKPLCSVDCKGLCQHCGKDLNEGPCSCKEEETEPRWRRLTELKRL